MLHTLILPTNKPRVMATVQEFFRREPAFSSAALLLIMLMIPTLAAMSLETRTVLGENAWIKPFKFELALAMYLGTLAWFAGWLPTGMINKTTYRVYSYIVVFCVLGEIVWIGGAALFGTRSHFNSDSSLMSGVYTLMGIFAVTLTSAALFYAIGIARNKTSWLKPTFRLAVICGLVITFITTIIVAGYLSNRSGHLVGGTASGAHGFPIMGWSRDAGDLRVAHFFAAHAMHFIPAFGYISTKISETGYTRTGVIGFSFAYIGLIAYAFTGALNGQPFLG